MLKRDFREFQGTCLVNSICRKGRQALCQASQGEPAAQHSTAPQLSTSRHQKYTLQNTKDYFHTPKIYLCRRISTGTQQQPNCWMKPQNGVWVSQHRRWVEQFNTSPPLHKINSFDLIFFIQVFKTRRQRVKTLDSVSCGTICTVGGAKRPGLTNQRRV